MVNQIPINNSNPLVHFVVKMNISICFKFVTVSSAVGIVSIEDYFQTLG